MAMPVVFTLDAKPFAKAMAGAPGVYYRHVRKAMREIGSEFEREYVAQALSGHGVASLGRRTGSARRSFAGRAVSGKDLGALHLVVGFGPPAVPTWAGGAQKYIHVHETGMTIRAKKGANLAIPIGPGMTRAGVSRYGSPGEHADVWKFGMSRRTGSKWLVPWAQPTKGGKPNIHYVLKPSVTIPPRLRFGERIAAYWPKAQDRLRAANAAAAAEVSGGKGGGAAGGG